MRELSLKASIQKSQMQKKKWKWRNSWRWYTTW